MNSASATPVVPLSPSIVDCCPVCEKPAMWAIGVEGRACTGHVGEVLAQLYRDEPHPFHPHLPVPLRRGKW